MKSENPPFVYDKQVNKYFTVRKTDPIIKKYVNYGLRNMNTVINIGAGTGSYEPVDKYVIAVEPSEKMRKKRLESGRIPAINARADSLPFSDNSFDASLAILTIHHWPDLRAGLKEVKRVTRNRIVILTYDPDELDKFWNMEYFPGVVEAEKNRYPKLLEIAEVIGIQPRIIKIKIPFNCADGFQEAFYGRPEAFLKNKIRRSQSAWEWISRELEAEYIAHLKKEVDNGEWDRKYGHYRKMRVFEGAYRMLEFNRPSKSTKS